MAARPDVGCVVHTHSSAATAFAALGEPLRAISRDGVEFADPPVPVFTLTGSLIRTAELGAALADTVGDGVGALIPQHGLVTVGPDPATAVMRAVLLDRACRVQLDAIAAGPPLVQRRRDRAEEGRGMAARADPGRLPVPASPNRPVSHPRRRGETKPALIPTGRFSR
jgi:ribulose-5-phosphate 4-epimerase/fuculose-1-phosphate aldolase